VPF
jgi:hypothetical protein